MYTDPKVVYYIFTGSVNDSPATRKEKVMEFTVVLTVTDFLLQKEQKAIGRFVTRLEAVCFIEEYLTRLHPCEGLWGPDGYIVFHDGAKYVYKVVRLVEV